MTPLRIGGARCSTRGLPAAVRRGAPRLVGAPADTGQALDISTLCTYVDDQIGDRCVGQGFAGALWIAARASRARPSPRGIYVGARAREVASALGGPIPDVGSEPADAVAHLVSVGCYPRDDRDDDPGATTALDTWEETAASVPVSPFAFHALDQGDVAGLRSALLAQYGVVICMPVYESFMTLSGPSVWRGPVNGERTVGGHCMVAVGSLAMGATRAVKLWNSWGPSWCDRGFGYVDETWLMAHSFEPIAVVMAPVLS